MTTYINKRGNRVYVVETGDGTAYLCECWPQMGSRPMCGFYASIDAAQHALRKRAKRRGWKEE